MLPIINVALDLRDRALSRQIMGFLTPLDGITVVQMESGNGSLPPATAQVVVVDDRDASQEVIDKLHKLQAQRPNAAVFVVSGSSDTRHIVEVMKAGAAECLLVPVSWDELVAALHRVAERLRQPVTSTTGSVYSFISSKGGVGATVLAVNIAVALAMRGTGQVALLDNSLQSGDSSVLLDLVPDRTIEDVCRQFHRLDAAFLSGAMASHATGLHVLAAPVAPEGRGLIDAERLSGVLHLAQGLYDQTVVDCQSMSVDPCSEVVFKASDKIFIVSDQSVPAVRNAARLMEGIRKLRVDRERIEVIVNRFIKGRIPPVSEVDESVGRRVFWLFPNDYDAVTTSINEGMPLVKRNPRNAFSRGVHEFVERLLDPSSAKGSYRGMKGPLGRAL
jgi:pilus assembly protein CpaE